MSEERKTLKSIFDYIGADAKYAEHAQLHTYLEWYKKKPCSTCEELQKSYSGCCLERTELHKENTTLKADNKEFVKLNDILNARNEKFKIQFLSEKHEIRKLVAESDAYRDNLAIQQELVKHLQDQLAETRRVIKSYWKPQLVKEQKELSQLRKGEWIDKVKNPHRRGHLASLSSLSEHGQKATVWELCKAAIKKSLEEVV